ncbi:MAG: heavy metal-binding domain-containing protein [Streptosporangiaceae bacterium]
MRRLAELRPGRLEVIFTSDLTVNEFLLVKEAGFTPLGLVLGSSIYHIGLQASWVGTRLRRWGRNQELTMLSQALYHARELAMARMQAEADLLGADGIVGVRLEVEVKQWGRNLAEFIAVGTAVKANEGASWRAHGRPFTSDLSGQDFWTLVKTGYAPVGLVMGSCVYHIARRRLLRTAQTLARNIELEQFTQALYDARELAMARMQAEAERLEAEGVVGVQLRQHSHTWGGHTTEFFAIGTAVRPTGADHGIPPPRLVLGLDE